MPRQRPSSASVLSNNPQHKSRNRRPWDIDTTDSCGTGFHGYRALPTRKDHRLYEHKPQPLARRGPLFEMTLGSAELQLGGGPEGVTMRQTSYDYGCNAILRRQKLAGPAYSDGVAVPGGT